MKFGYGLPEGEFTPWYDFEGLEGRSRDGVWEEEGYPVCVCFQRDQVWEDGFGGGVGVGVTVAVAVPIAIPASITVSSSTTPWGVGRGRVLS